MSKQDNIVSRFKTALQKTEQTSDATHIASLFAEGARLSNLGGDYGTDARKFWQTYLDQFGEVRSEFTAEIVGERGAALEWRSRGTTADAKPVEYGGVSLLEFDGDKLTGFRTYYDSAAFLAR